MKKVKFSRNELLRMKEWVCEISIANHTDSQDSQERIEMITEQLRGALELKLANSPIKFTV